MASVFFPLSVLLPFSHCGVCVNVGAAAEDWGRCLLQTGQKGLRSARWQSSGAHPQIRRVPWWYYELKYLVFSCGVVGVFLSDALLFCCLLDCENKGGNSNRLVACITTLYLFSKIRAQLMVKHAMTMQPYLTTKCNVRTQLLNCYLLSCLAI